MLPGNLFQPDFSFFSGISAQGLHGCLISSKMVNALMLPCAEVCSAWGTGLAGHLGLLLFSLKCLTKLHGSKISIREGRDLCAQASASQPAVRVGIRDDVRRRAEPECRRRVRSNYKVQTAVPVDRRGSSRKHRLLAGQQQWEKQSPSSKYGQSSQYNGKIQKHLC